MFESKRFAWFFLFVITSSVIAHHLISDVSFPFSPGYEFPLWNIVFSVIMSMMIFYSIDVMYNKWFKHKERSSTLFLMISEAIITVLYSIGYVSFLFVFESTFEWLNFLQGLLISILGFTLLLIIFYAKELSELIRGVQPPESILIESGAHTRRISIDSIAYFFIENEIVYTVLKDGKRFAGNIKLRDLEEKLKDHPFFRINRQFIVSQDAVQSIKKDVNQKLLVTIEPADQVKEPLTVSRYKYKDFQNWVSKA